MNEFGLIGGTSWHSTIEYYAYLNQYFNEKHSDNTNPPLRIISLNQKEIHHNQQQDRWDLIEKTITESAIKLQNIGVKGIALCANTPHKVYESVQEKIDIPILHIGDSIGKKLHRLGVKKTGLLGTTFTMKEDFIKSRLRSKYSIQSFIPSEKSIDIIQSIFYNKLSKGIFDEQSIKIFITIIDELTEQSVEAVILGCTEFPILLKNSDLPIQLVDGTKAHCEDIAKFIETP